MNARANIKEFRRLDKEVQSAEADVEAKRWRQAELAWEAVEGESKMRRRAYADAVGVHGTTIGLFVAAWNRWGAVRGLHRPRFADAISTVKAGSDEVITKADQARREKQRQVPTRHDDRVEMAGKLLADPEVAKAAVPAVLGERSKSQRVIEQEVSRKNARERKRQVEEASRRRNATAAPLPAYMSRMVVKINEWAAGLAAIENDLESLPPGRGREIVLDTLRELAKQTQRCIARLERQPEQDVIEGRAA